MITFDPAMDAQTHAFLQRMYETLTLHAWRIDVALLDAPPPDEPSSEGWRGDATTDFARLEASLRLLGTLPTRALHEVGCHELLHVYTAYLTSTVTHVLLPAIPAAQRKLLSPIYDSAIEQLVEPLARLLVQLLDT